MFQFSIHISLYTSSQSSHWKIYFSYDYTNRKKIPRNFSPCSSSLIHKIVSNNLLSSNIMRFGHDTKLFFDSLKRKDRTMIKMIIITLYQISMSMSKLGNICGCILDYTNAGSQFVICDKIFVALVLEHF